MQEAAIDPLPKVPLYHYTSLEGLVGIATTKTLRSTHIAHLNDSEELTLAVELLESAVEQHLQDAYISPED